MAKYNVGGVNPFNRKKTIHLALAEALTGDEINWSKNERYTDPLIIRHGLHVFANNNIIKVPEHSIGVILNGSGSLIIEDLRIQITTLANGLQIQQWKGEIIFRNCEFYYKKRLREDKVYPLISTNEFQNNLTIQFEDCSIAGVNIGSNELIITNSNINYSYIDNNFSSNLIVSDNSTLTRSYIDANTIKTTNTSLIDNITLKSNDGDSELLSTKINGENISIVGDFIFDDVTFSNECHSVVFNQNNITLKNVYLPKIPIYSENSSFVIKNNVNNNAIWNSKSTSFSNKATDRKETNTSAVAELNNMIGLKEVKETIKKYIASSYTNKLRQEKGLSTLSASLHLIFSGSPGTGKTTVAKIFARALFEEGILPTSNVVIAERKDLIGEYHGHTAPLTTSTIESALGGVLFIDEAYDLTPREGNGFENEALTILNQMMEDYKDNLVVILAGYPDEMRTFLDKANPGFKSRFTQWVNFHDYSFNELFEIMKKMIGADYILDEEIVDTMKTGLENFYKNNYINGQSGNARFVRNYVQEISFSHSNRISEISEPSLTDLQTIEVEDIVSATYNYKKQLDERDLSNF